MAMNPQMLQSLMQYLSQTKGGGRGAQQGQAPQAGGYPASVYGQPQEEEEEPDPGARLTQSLLGGRR